MGLLSMFGGRFECVFDKSGGTLRIERRLYGQGKYNSCPNRALFVIKVINAPYG